MIESDKLPEEAVNYLNEIEGAKEKQMHDMAIFGAKTELLSHCKGFITKSEGWRNASYENKWKDYQRAADGIYDPAIAAKKEAWQSKVHVDLTASHRESIHSHIFKTMCGVNPPLEVKARIPLGDEDQSENIRDITLREMDKARWEVEVDKVLNDADTFGSGFIRRYYKTTIEKRKLRKERTEQFTDDLNPMGMVGYASRAAMGKLKKSYETIEEDVITYRGLELKHISIWDVFPDPKALQIRGSSIAVRFRQTYEDIVKGAQEGYYLESAVEELKDVEETQKYPQGEDTVQGNREVSDGVVDKTNYQKEFELFEFFARLPKKWIYPMMDEEFENGEELVPARVIFHKHCLVAVEVNQDYEGEPCIDKMDYMPRNNSFYGIGIPEMVRSPQSVVNEIVNQRLDNGAQALNHSFAVIEKALVNPKQDLVSKPGQILRLDAKYVPNGDARNAISQIEINDTPVRAGFAEVNEAERWAQERSGSNRIMMGSTGTGKDGTKTLGEQQMLKEAGGEKFSYIGFRIELGFSQELFKGIWKTIYPHITPEDIEESIGEERAQSFILVNPEELSRDYVYKPMGIFTMTNKATATAQAMQLRQTFVGAPWLDDEKIFDIIARSMDQDPDKFKKTEEQILQDQAGMIGQEGMPPMGPEGMPNEMGAPPPTEEVPPIPMPSEPKSPSKSPEHIRDDYRSGKITRKEAARLLREEHGFE
jgi:hypothetical protein